MYRSRHKLARALVPAALGACLGMLAGCDTYPRTTTTRTTPEQPESRGTATATTAPAGMSRVAMAYPTGTESTSLMRIEKTMPKEVRVNEQFAYEVSVTNISPLALRDVVIHDNCSTNIRVDSSAPQARKTGDSRYEWPIGNLEARQTKTVKVTATATGSGPVNTCTTATYNPELCLAAIVVEPQLRVTRTAPAEAMLCDQIPIRYVVTNTGTGTIHGATVRDTLPRGLTTPDGKTSVAFDAGTLAAGQSKSFDVAARASAPGTYEGKATAAGRDGLTAESSINKTIVRQPVLALQMEGSPKRYFGAPVKFELTVKNTGDAPAIDTSIENPLPSGATFVSATEGGRLVGSNVVWRLASLGPGDSRLLQLSFNPERVGTIANRAEAKAACASPASATAATEVEGIPAVLLEVVDETDPVLVGENTVYIITVTNQGSQTDTNISIACELPEKATFVSATGDTRGTADGRKVTFAPLATLSPKAKAQWRVTVKASGPADARFRVNMNTDFLERDVSETEATRFYEFR